MNIVALPLLLLSLASADGKATPKMPLGKDTTYVTGPLDKEGYVDYETALNDRLGKGILPEKNANVLIWKALGPTPDGGQAPPAELFRRMGMKELPKDGAYFIGLAKFANDSLKREPTKLDALWDQQARAGQRPWKAADFPYIAGWLKANEKPLALVIEASKRPDYFNPHVNHPDKRGPGALMGALLPSVQKCRELVSALTCRAMLRVSEGQVEKAWQDLLACHRLARLVARGASLIEALIGYALDALASNADLAFLDGAQLTSKQIQNCLRDLQSLKPMPPLADKLTLAERFAFLDAVQLIRRGGVGKLEVLAGGDFPKVFDKDPEKVMAVIDWAPPLRAGNAWFDRLAAASRLEVRADQKKVFDKIEKDLKVLAEEAVQPENLAKVLIEPDKTSGKEIGNILIRLLVPAVGKVQQAHDRSNQIQRNLHVAFALAAYKQDHGRYPANLKDLKPKYQLEVPGDIFSGKELIYRTSEKGYLLYSVGVNGKDDGGRWHDDNPPGDDLRVRMPLPDLKEKKDR